MAIFIFIICLATAFLEGAFCDPPVIFFTLTSAWSPHYCHALSQLAWFEGSRRIGWHFRAICHTTPYLRHLHLHEHVVSNFIIIIKSVFIILYLASLAASVWPPCGTLEVLFLIYMLQPVGSVFATVCCVYIHGHPVGVAVMLVFGSQQVGIWPQFSFATDWIETSGHLENMVLLAHTETSTGYQPFSRDRLYEARVRLGQESRCGPWQRCFGHLQAHARSC